MSEIITTLHKKGDATVEVYPNIKRDNIPSNAINNSKIEDGAITESKIYDASVARNKLAYKCVNADKIDDLAVTTDKINNSAVTSAKIQDSAVTNFKLGDNSVSNEKLQDGAVTHSKLGSKVVTLDNIDDSARIYTYQKSELDLAAVTGISEAKLYLTFYGYNSLDNATIQWLANNLTFTASGYIETSTALYLILGATRTGSGITFDVFNTTSNIIGSLSYTWADLDNPGNNVNNIINGYPE